MGIVQKPTARSYISKRRIISTPGFADVISRQRFELICKFLYFIDNESFLTYQGPPILFKIYPVICHLNIKFQTLYLPNQNIAIDEILTLWKGRLSTRQYLPLKASKFRIKTFELCESRTGYLWCFLVYTGKNMVPQLSLITPDTPKTAAVLLELLEPLFDRGRMLWIDNFFNSTELARKLKIEHSTDCVGTLGRNIQQLSYRIQLVEGLFMKYARAAETRIVPERQVSDNTVPQLTERHFLRKVAPKTEKSNPQGCVVWSKHGKKKTAVYCCQICDVGLCLEEFFELYHTKLNY